MSLGELPDDVLVAVLGHLSLHERWVDGPWMHVLMHS